MNARETLFAVTLDGAPFALVTALDAVEAVDLAYGLFTVGIMGQEPANDHDPDLLVRAGLTGRLRLAARAPSEAERHQFAVRRQELPGVRLAAILAD